MIVSVILILLISLGIGLPLTMWIVPNHNLWGKLGFSYLLGLGLFTLVMFLSNILGVRFSLGNSLILLLPVLPLIFLQRKRMKVFYTELKVSARFTGLTFPEKVTVGIIAFLVISSFFYTFYWPAYMWDSIVLYDFRAHVFADTGFMNPAFMNAYYRSYPLLTSLAHTIVYIAGGKYPQIFDSLFYLSLGLCFYGALREFVSRKTGLIFLLFLLLSSPLYFHSITSYTNLPYTVYISLSAICVYLWDKKKDTGYLIMSALLAGLSTWTRSTEPFWLAVLIAVFIVSIYRRKIWSAAYFSLIFFPFYELWKAYQSAISGGKVLTAGQTDAYSQILPALLDIQHWEKIFAYLYKYVVVSWGMIFAAFLLAAAAAVRLKIFRKYFLIFFITLMFLATFVAGTFVFSIYIDNWIAIGDAAQRLSMLFYPLFAFCIALVSQEFVKMKK